MAANGLPQQYTLLSESIEVLTRDLYRVRLTSVGPMPERVRQALGGADLATALDVARLYELTTFVKR